MPKKARFTIVKVRGVHPDKYPKFAECKSNRFSGLSDEDRLNEIVQICASLLVQQAMECMPQSTDTKKAA